MCVRERPLLARIERGRRDAMPYIAQQIDDEETLAIVQPSLHQSDKARSSKRHCCTPRGHACCRAICCIIVLIVIVPALWLAVRYNHALTFFDNIICIAVTLASPKSWQSYESNKAGVVRVQKMLRAAEPGFRADIEHKHGALLTYGIWETNSTNGHRLSMHVTRPRANESGPIILYIPGGGMATSSPCDGFFGSLIERYGSARLIVSLAYRVAIEGHQFPKSLEDGDAALRFLAASYPSRGIVICGVSAGAFLALTTAMRARDHGGPSTQIEHVFAVAPSQHIDEDMSRESGPCAHMGTEGWFATSNSVSLFYMQFYWHELWVRPADRTSPDLDLRRASYVNLPPTTIAAMDYDCTSCEALDIHERLVRAAGNTNSTLLRNAASHAAGSGFLLSQPSAARELDRVVRFARGTSEAHLTLNLMG